MVAQWLKIDQLMIVLGWEIEGRELGIEGGDKCDKLPGQGEQTRTNI